MENRRIPLFTGQGERTGSLILGSCSIVRVALRAVVRYERLNALFLTKLIPHRVRVILRP